MAFPEPSEQTNTKTKNPEFPMSSDFMAMDCSPLSELKTTLSIQVYVQIAYHIIFMIQ